MIILTDADQIEQQSTPVAPRLFERWDEVFQAIDPLKLFTPDGEIIWLGRGPEKISSQAARIPPFVAGLKIAR